MAIQVFPANLKGSLEAFLKRGGVEVSPRRDGSMLLYLNGEIGSLTLKAPSTLEVAYTGEALQGLFKQFSSFLAQAVDETLRESRSQATSKKGDTPCQ